MRVMLIHPHDPTTFHMGGIGTFLNTFLKYAPADFEVSLVGITRHPGKYPVGRWQSLDAGGKTYSFLPIAHQSTIQRSRIPLSLRFTWALRKYRSSIDFKDAIFEFHRIEPNFVLKNFRNPKVLFLHGHMEDLYNPKTEVGWGKFPGLYFWLEQKSIREMKHVYIVREDAIAFYRKRYPHFTDRFSFLPTWADECTFFSADEPTRRGWKEQFAREHNFDPANQILLFVGRFEGQKDPLLLLEAFRRLNGQSKKTILVMIGAGTLESSMRGFAEEHKISDTVRILGPMPQEMLCRWMNAANCLCLSSAFEGMPRAVVEALQCGLPVVSTDAGEVKRLLGNSQGGRVVVGRTPENFRSALVDLLSHLPNREICQKQVRSYSAPAVLKEVYDAYRQF